MRFHNYDSFLCFVHFFYTQWTTREMAYSRSLLKHLLLCGTFFAFFIIIAWLIYCFRKFHNLHSETRLFGWNKKLLHICVLYIIFPNKFDVCDIIFINTSTNQNQCKKILQSLMYLISCLFNCVLNKFTPYITRSNHVCITTYCGKEVDIINKKKHLNRSSNLLLPHSFVTENFKKYILQHIQAHSQAKCILEVM